MITFQFIPSFLIDKFISTCQFSNTFCPDTIRGKSNITTQFLFAKMCLYCNFKKFHPPNVLLSNWLYCKRKSFFLIILHRLCIHLIKRGFAKKIAWQMVKRTFHDLWIICAPLNYVWSRIIKKHKTTRASQRRQ